jgi:hypothetical protein
MQEHWLPPWEPPHEAWRPEYTPQYPDDQEVDFEIESVVSVEFVGPGDLTRAVRAMFSSLNYKPSSQYSDIFESDAISALSEVLRDSVRSIRSYDTLVRKAGLWTYVFARGTPRAAQVLYDSLERKFSHLHPPYLHIDE